MKTNTVYIVHAVDTEGPLYESLRANFERIEEIFGHKIDPSIENLQKLQNEEIALYGDEEKVKRVLTGKRINTHGSWDKIDNMLDIITSRDFRERVKDSFGGGWVYNWQCMSHVGVTGINPRRRDMGYHNIYDHYVEYFDRKNDATDLIQWHYHALSITNDAHRAGSTYLNSDHIYNVLSRSIIDRSTFPAVFRAGHITERPDSHFFLEQWIPFDFSNASPGINSSDSSSSLARYGDWRRAPKSWVPYHPSHDDYQQPGACRRYIARCLSIDERDHTITKDDIAKAFKDAGEHGASILSFTNHDFRDMKKDIENMMELIDECNNEHPSINYKYSTAIDAMRAVCGMEQINEIGLRVELKEFKSHVRLVVSASGELFGPQPYLALKTKSNTYFWQNFDFEDHNTWSYSFDINNILIDQIAEIGVASNSITGLTEIVNLNPHTGEQKKTVLNP